MSLQCTLLYQARCVMLRIKVFDVIGFKVIEYIICFHSYIFPQHATFKIHWSIYATFPAFWYRWRSRNRICWWTLHFHSLQDVPLYKHSYFKSLATIGPIHECIVFNRLLYKRVENQSRLLNYYLRDVVSLKLKLRSHFCSCLFQIWSF